MIRFENVSFAYEANPEKLSLDDVSFEIGDGQCVLVTGESGCGKSTIIRLINGLIPEFYPGERKGKIYIDNDEITEKEIYDFVGKIGTVFQNPRAQFFNVDTTGELAFGLENLSVSEDEILKKIDKTVEIFHIEKLMDKSIFNLSGGEKQKIACASVDVLDPSIILLDEPSANLDYDAMNKLRDVICEWKNQGKTIIIAEHRISYICDIVDRVIYMENGKNISDWSKDEFSCFDEAECERYGLRSLKRTSPIKLAQDKNAYETDDNVKDIQEDKVYKTDKADNDRYIILKDFKFAYSGKNYVLDISKMHIKREKVTAIIGENGIGKTTFMECLCGIKKNKGILISDGKEYNYKKRLKEIFMVMQDPNHQLFTESVLDEVLISMPDEDVKKARQILKEVDLVEYEKRHPMSLSGGQKQRVAIACAIASKRPIILMDEPTSGLDKKYMLEVADILNKLKTAGRTIITVTHDSEFIENCCDDIKLLK
ncbi:MAG: ABC transporter ATP-binding protein [Lachnospiraceae bacterium]|nr:ABC transporter ATP-binding protein [Lachnospiraceae bacterium]